MNGYGMPNQSSFASLFISFPSEVTLYHENSLRKTLRIERTRFNMLRAQGPDLAIRIVIFRWTIKLKP